MHVGELAERTGLSIRTIRHYDEVGLVTPSGRTAGGFRIYTGADEDRVLLVKAMKPLGYSLEQMKELLEVIDSIVLDPANTLAQERLRELEREAVHRRETLQRHLVVADGFITSLSTYRSQ